MISQSHESDADEGKFSSFHSCADLPPVKPSAIALGTVFNHTASLAIMAPLFGDTYHRAQRANSSEEFLKSKEAASAAAAWGSSLVGSALQTYGVGALINATGTLTYKGAAYLGSLIFLASSAPSVCSFYEPTLFLFFPVDGKPRGHFYCLSLNLYFSSSRKSSKRGVPWILWLLVPSPVFSRLWDSACSSPGGELVPVLSVRS